MSVYVLIVLSVNETSLIYLVYLLVLFSVLIHKMFNHLDHMHYYCLHVNYIDYRHIT